MSDWVSRGLPVTSGTSNSIPCLAKIPLSRPTQGIEKTSLGETMAVVTFSCGGAVGWPAG
jgi:hypothetical protein